MTNTSRIMDRIVAYNPDLRPGRIFRASVEVYRRADTGPMRAAIEKILTNEPGSEKDPFVASQRYTLALYDRDWDAAGRAAAVLSQKNSLPWGFPSTWPRLLGGCSRSFERRRNFCTRCFYEGTRTTGGRDPRPP